MNDFDFTDTTTARPRKYKPGKRTPTWVWIGLVILIVGLPCFVGFNVWRAEYQRTQRRQHEAEMDRIREMNSQIDDDIDDLNRRMGNSEAVVTQKRMLRVMERGQK